MALIHSVRAAKLTNTPAFMKESGSVETGLSDHKLVYTVLDSKLIRPKAAVIKKRSFKYFDQTAFLEDLNRVPFSAAYVFDDPDDVYWCWEKLYAQVLDDHVPIISFKKRSSVQSKFITAAIRRAMKERNRLKKKFNKTRLDDDWESYRLLRNKVVSMRRRAVQEYFQKMCEEKYSDQKKFWSTIKPYINSRKSTQNGSGRIVLKENETLNKFFTSIEKYRIKKYRISKKFERDVQYQY